MNLEKPPGEGRQRRTRFLQKPRVSQAFIYGGPPFSGIIYHDLLLGSGRLRPEVVKTGEVPSEPYRPGRKLHPLKKCRKTCRKWVTREENSVMIDPIGGFCYGNDKTKETKKIPGKTKRGTHDGSTCTGCADSGRHNVRFPL